MKGLKKQTGTKQRKHKAKAKAKAKDTVFLTHTDLINSHQAAKANKRIKVWKVVMMVTVAAIAGVGAYIGWKAIKARREKDSQKGPKASGTQKTNTNPGTQPGTQSGTQSGTEEPTSDPGTQPRTEEPSPNPGTQSGPETSSSTKLVTEGPSWRTKLMQNLPWVIMGTLLLLLLGLVLFYYFSLRPRAIAANERIKDLLQQNDINDQVLTRLHEENKDLLGRIQDLQQNQQTVQQNLGEALQDQAALQENGASQEEIRKLKLEIKRMQQELARTDKELMEANALLEVNEDDARAEVLKLRAKTKKLEEILEQNGIVDMSATPLSEIQESLAELTNALLSETDPNKLFEIENKLERLSKAINTHPEYKLEQERLRNEWLSSIEAERALARSNLLDRLRNTLQLDATATEKDIIQGLDKTKDLQKQLTVILKPKETLGQTHVSDLIKIDLKKLGREELMALHSMLPENMEFTGDGDGKKRAWGKEVEERLRKMTTDGSGHPSFVEKFFQDLERKKAAPPPPPRKAPGRPTGGPIAGGMGGLLDAIKKRGQQTEEKVDEAVSRPKRPPTIGGQDFLSAIQAKAKEVNKNVNRAEEELGKNFQSGAMRNKEFVRGLESQLEMGDLIESMSKMKIRK